MTERLPLSGIRVVDFSWIIAGPTCARILALMGAEVLKVESHRRPDPSRRGGGAGFHMLNQGKKSITLNLSTTRGLELAKQLISVSDVVIENFATGVIERLGLGYDVLKELRPDIVMVSSSGLGHTGPDQGHVAYGTLLQCFTGWSAQTGFPGKSPLIGGAWTDPLTGMMQAFVIASTLHHRSESGTGQYVDFSMAETTSTLLPEAIMEYAMNGRVAERIGNNDGLYSPNDLYPCQGDDNWVAVAVTSHDEWRGLCDVIGREDLGEDKLLVTMAGRRDKSIEIDEAIRNWTITVTKTEAMHRLQAAGVPSGPSQTASDVFNDPHLEARGFFHTHRSAAGSDVRIVSVPWQFQNGPAPKNGRAPELGEHSSDILGEILGIPGDEIETLVGEQVIY